ncbi:hypothetical protein [Gimesia maris]|uniref:hypothetical protein n=1 Tax=Gimesia maris TaxID=122 RepID=UPI00241EA46E|nr:hypothetical protein [Gimesia maris]
MSRKIVSLVMIPFVLLTQSVTGGHSHAGNQPAGHELRAHIHLEFSAEEAQHGHVHSHGTHSHSHATDTATDHDLPVVPEVEFPFDHDSSAVYLNCADLSSGSRSTLKTELLLCFHWDKIQADTQVCSFWNATPEWGRHDCAPSGPEFPLFLRHHAFLI